MVSDKIVPGLKAQTQTIVCEHNIARHVSRYSSPSMISLMERASTEVIHHLLKPDQTSVGYEVNVRHIAPAPLGATIIAHAEITAIDRNKLTFKVAAFDGETKIGEGTHKRAIIGTDSSKK